MFHYFAEDGTETDDCTQARTLLPSGSTQPHLRLVWDGAPTADQLYERLVALLSPVAGDEDMEVLSKTNSSPATATLCLIVRSSCAWPTKRVAPRPESPHGSRRPIRRSAGIVLTTCFGAMRVAVVASLT